MRALIVVPACLIFPFVSAQAEDLISSAPLIRLRSFVEHPRPDRLEWVDGEAARLTADPIFANSVRAMVGDIFVSQWLDGKRVTGLDLAQFDSLAEAVDLFGRDHSRLVELIARPGVPAAWRDTDFRNWLRRSLPATAGGGPTAQRLLPAASAVEASALVQRFALALEVLPPSDLPTIDDYYAREIWGKADPARMASFHHELEAVESIAGLARLGRRPEAIRRQLGDRLLGMDVPTWTAAGDALEPLAQASSSGLQGFLAKAASLVKSVPAARTAETAAALSVLTSMAGPERSFAALRANDAPYVLWLHQAGILQPLLRDARVFDASLGLVRSLTTDANYRDFFPYIADVYYGNREEATFNALLREPARGAQAALVLGSAREGKFNPEHRETLARDNLATGSGLDPAWTGPNAPLRLALAIEIYNTLENPASGDGAALDSHVNRPLLRETLTKAIELTRRSPQDAEQALKMLDPLATHLRDCREHGADLSASRPLAELDALLAGEVRSSLDGLPALPNDRAPASLDDAQSASIDRFIQRFTLGLRISDALNRRAPVWLTEARAALQNRIFGLQSPIPGRAIVWSESMVRFRAAILTKIDPDLCSCLESHPNELELFFADVYLPLVRVRGFLSVCEVNDDGPFHRWGRREAPKQSHFEQIFSALDTNTWLGEDGAVESLARAHLRFTKQSTDPWLVDPANFFAGYWNRNANLRVWKSVIDGRQPALDAGWQLLSIAGTAVDELRSDRLVNGETWEPPERDRPDDLWQYAAWTENLVTAAEWQNYPFIRAGRALSWNNPVTGKPTEPFNFDLNEKADDRRVDGALRLKLYRKLRDTLPDDAPVGNQDEIAVRRDRLDRLAWSLLVLPNAAENSLRPDAFQEFNAAKIALYRTLHRIYVQAHDDLGQRMRFARLLMCLEISLRENGRMTPPFDGDHGIMSELEEEAMTNGALAEALGNLRDERARICGHLFGEQLSKADDARRRIDGHLEMLPKGFVNLNRQLFQRTYVERLEALNDEGVRNLLNLRKDVNELLSLVLDNSGQPVAAERAKLADDQRRIATVLDLFDYKLWYTRWDFDAHNYFKLQIPNLTAQVGQPKDWWPALTVLAVGDAEFQRRAMALTLLGNDSSAAEARKSLFRFTQAIFTTCTQVAVHGQAADMLNFDRQLPGGSTLDLKLLAVIRDPPVEANAFSLGQACFDGVITNVDLATHDAAPSDTLLQERLFGSLDAFLGEQPRALPPDAETLNVDTAVKLAARWADLPSIPSHLRDGAQSFLATTPDRLGALLRGSETPQGVLAAACEILNRSLASTDARYRRFYDGFLTNRDTLADRFYDAAAEAMYRQSLDEQRRSVEAFFGAWRLLPVSAKDDPELARALRGDLGSVIERLVQGVGAVGGPHLWQPVEDFTKENGVRSEPPREFLNFASWWFALEQSSDRPEMKKLFQLEKLKP